MPYSFFIENEEIVSTLFNTLTNLVGKQNNQISDEAILKIIYQPQAIFKVRSITHCTSSLPGHTEAILSVAFSPDGLKLATGSGDTTIRLWDTLTETPYKECKGHTNWVSVVKWSPDGNYFASGSMDRTVRVWNAAGDQICVLKGHTQFITNLSWEPLHIDGTSRRLVSSSKDGTARIWDISVGSCLRTLSGHKMSVTSVLWGGEGLIYTGSQDRTISVWTADEGKLCRVLNAHGHWVNTMALNTDYVLRTGAYDHTGKEYDDPEEAKKRAYERWLEVKGKGPEILATGSDDFTVYLWHPSVEKKPLTRLTGHARLINVVSWSPNGRLLASASFDRNIKLWSSSGKYITTFRGHVGEVYQLCWSSDSRMFVTGSKDSTLKVWDAVKKKIKENLPGHADEVYTVDWSPDGQRVASGSKDRLLKIWRN